MNTRSPSVPRSVERVQSRRGYWIAGSHFRGGSVCRRQGRRYSRPEGPRCRRALAALFRPHPGVRPYVPFHVFPAPPGVPPSDTERSSSPASKTSSGYHLGSGRGKSQPWNSASLALSHMSKGSVEAARRAAIRPGSSHSRYETAVSPRRARTSQTFCPVTPSRRRRSSYSSRREPESSCKNRRHRSSLPARMGPAKPTPELAKTLTLLSCPDNHL